MEVTFQVVGVVGVHSMAFLRISCTHCIFVEDGRSMKISKQSIMTAHFGKCLQKSMGSVFLRTSHSGHSINFLSLTYRISITLAKTQLAVDL